MKEEDEYVRAIIDDVKWLGFEWCAMTHSSDYYQELYDFACLLIQKGLAYVDSLSIDEIRAYRGTLQEPGRDSPYRTRSVEENLALFQRMKAGNLARESMYCVRKLICNQATLTCEILFFIEFGMLRINVPHRLVYLPDV